MQWILRRLVCISTLFTYARSTVVASEVDWRHSSQHPHQHAEAKDASDSSNRTHVAISAGGQPSVMRREAPKHEHKTEPGKTLEHALERASEIAKRASPADAAYRESLLKEVLQLVEHDGRRSSAAVQLEEDEAQHSQAAVLGNSTTPGATTTGAPSTTASTQAPTPKPATARATTTQRTSAKTTTTVAETKASTTRRVTFEIITTTSTTLAHHAVIKHSSPVTLTTHAPDVHHEGTGWSAHIANHWEAHADEPMHEAEPWSVSVGSVEHAPDVHQAAHDEAPHLPEEYHGPEHAVSVEESLPSNLPHVHISIEPPPPGSAPLTVSGAILDPLDHPTPTMPPPVNEQAVKDSAAAGTEAADAALQMGLPAERQASVAAAAAAAAAAAEGMNQEQQASAAQDAANRARLSAVTSSTRPPVADHVRTGYEDATIETWPALFKAKGCRKDACQLIDGLFHEVGENEGHPMYAKDGDDEVTLYFLNDNEIAKKGWWVGQFPGSGTTYAFNPSQDVLPPMVGWRVPWNSPLPDADLRFIKEEDQMAYTIDKPLPANHSHMPEEEWIHMPPTEYLPTASEPPQQTSRCPNESVAPKGSWVVYNGSDGVHSDLPAICRGFDADALVPEECCNLPNRPNLFGVKFQEVYETHGSCATVDGHGLFLESFNVKLKCNSDNSILYGHDCNSGCQCGAEHAFRPGCYRGLDRMPSTTWFFTVRGCECDGNLPTHYQSITGHAGPELHIGDLPSFEVSGCQDSITAHVIGGIYSAVGVRNDKPSFKKVTNSPEDQVSMYYGQSSDRESEGWWIGSGTEHIYAFNPSKEELPPFSGWKAPWWSGVDMTVKVDIADKDHHPMDVVKDVQEDEHEDHHGHPVHEHEAPDDLEPHEDEAMKPEEVMPPEDSYGGIPHVGWEPIMDAFSKVHDSNSQQIMKALKALVDHMKDVEKTVAEMQAELHPISPASSPVHPLEEAVNMSAFDSKPLAVSGCSMEDVCSKIEGTYYPSGFYLGRPTYHRQEGGGDVVIYYHHDGDDASLHGWWFGPDTMEFGTSQNWAFNPEDSFTPPLSGWHVPWSGPVDPSVKVTEAFEDVPMDVMKMNHSFPPVEEPVEEPMQGPTDDAAPPPEPTPPNISEMPEHAHFLPPAVFDKELNPEQAREVIQDQADMIAAAVKKLSSGKSLADLVLGIDTETIPREPPSEEFIARLAEDPKLAKKALNKLVTVLEEAVRRLESGEAFADEMFGRHMSEEEAELNASRAAEAAEADSQPAAAAASPAAAVSHSTSLPQSPVPSAKLPPMKNSTDASAPSTTEPPIAHSAAAPLLNTVDKVAMAANNAAEKARRWKDAEIAEARAKMEAEKAKKDVEKMTVEAAKEEAEKAIEQAADEEAREAKKEAAKEAETAQGEAKAKASKVAAAKKKLEEIKGQVPKEAKDAADKAVHKAEEHAQMKEEKVHEARFALEDLGPDAPAEVKEAAEEALSKAEEEADTAKSEVEDARHTLDAMKTTVTPEQRETAEKELAQAEEESKQAKAKAKDAAKKAGDIKLTSHDPAADNVLYSESGKVKEDKGGAVVMGTEPQTDTEKGLQEQLTALQSKLTGLERLQVKDHLDDELKDNASLRQVSVGDGSPYDVEIHAVQGQRSLVEKATEAPEELVATKDKSEKPEKSTRPNAKGLKALVIALILMPVIGAALYLRRRWKKQGEDPKAPEESKPLLEQKEENGNAEGATQPEPSKASDEAAEEKAETAVA